MDKPLEYKCDQCQKTFAEKNQYASHRSSCGKMNFKCSICDCKFRNQNALGLHISKHKCEICNKVFSKPEHKVRHMKNVHGKNEYSCKVCEKVFKFETKLHLHIRKDHLEKKNKLPTCNICGISFSYD